MATTSASRSASNEGGIHKIRHIVIIMQENRSFDHYFGTFPGADGIPMKDGVPTVCVPQPPGPCVRPYRDSLDRNRGGAHNFGAAKNDINGGKMDGFLTSTRGGRKCVGVDDPTCVKRAGKGDVMGYHDDHDIPNYWAYARDNVLQDRMFENIASWSLPQHLFMVSEWSASCRNCTSQ